MPRYCFSLQVDPDRMDDYVVRHEAVWPEMLDALEASGWRNYSLFLRKDGLLIGIVEAANFDTARAAMARTNVNARWQAAMAEYFEGSEGGPADEDLVLLTEVFNLEEQQARRLDNVKDAPSHD